MNKSKGKIVINTKWCKGCGLCIPACPKNCINLSDEPDLRGICTAVYDDEKNCTGCGLCAIICPDVAINVYKRAAD